jgi:hypothetical protein
VGGASLLWLHRSTSAPSIGNLIWGELWLTLAKYLWRPSQCGHKLDDWTDAIFTVGLQKGWCANKDTHPFLWELLKRWVYHTSWKKVVPDLYVSIMGSVLTHRVNLIILYVWHLFIVRCRVTCDHQYTKLPILADFVQISLNYERGKKRKKERRRRRRRRNETKN